jgi:hypothetical protein
MGDKPKKPKASAAEQASAAVGMAEHNYFKQKYGPLLRKMRDQSRSDDPTQQLRGRANADTMQALSGQNAERTVRGQNSGGDVANALTGQLGIAGNSGLGIQNQMATNVLGTARQQASDAQTGMAQASRLATSDALARAQAKNEVSNAKFKAVGEVAGAVLAKGFGNMQTSGRQSGPMGSSKEVRGTFWSPVDEKGNKFGFMSQKGWYG